MKRKIVALLGICFLGLSECFAQAQAPDATRKEGDRAAPSARANANERIVESTIIADPNDPTPPDVNAQRLASKPNPIIPVDPEKDLGAYVDASVIEPGEVRKSEQYFYLLPSFYPNRQEPTFSIISRGEKTEELFNRWKEEIEKERIIRGLKTYDLAEAVCRKNPEWLDPQIWEDINISNCRVKKPAPLSAREPDPPLNTNGSTIVRTERINLNVSEDLLWYDTKTFDSSYAIPVSLEGLQKTKSWKEKQFFRVRFDAHSLPDVSFQDFRFQYCMLKIGDASRCDFTNARFIQSRVEVDFTQEQEKSTWNYQNNSITDDSMIYDRFLKTRSQFAQFATRGVKGLVFNEINACATARVTRKDLESSLRYSRGELTYVNFEEADLSGADLSRTNLSNSRFPGAIMRGVNLAYSIVTDCDFSESEGLTLDQIKTTWNWKLGQMKNVALPTEIKKEIEENWTNKLGESDASVKTARFDEILQSDDPYKDPLPFEDRILFLYIEPEETEILPIAIDEGLRKACVAWNGFFSLLEAQNAPITKGLVRKSGLNALKSSRINLENVGLQGSCIREIPFLERKDGSRTYGLPITINLLNASLTGKSGTLFHVNLYVDQFEGFPQNINALEKCLLNCRECRDDCFDRNNATVRHVVLERGFSLRNIVRLRDIGYANFFNPENVVLRKRPPRSSCGQDLSDVDLSGTDLTGMSFDGSNLQGMNLTNAVVTQCDFSNARGLTIEQLQSTWNGQVGRLESVLLPEELRATASAITVSSSATATKDFDDPSSAAFPQETWQEDSLRADGRLFRVVDPAPRTRDIENRAYAIGDFAEVLRKFDVGWQFPLSGVDLTGARFSGTLTGRERFDDSIISFCDFSNRADFVETTILDSDGIRVEQLKTTWNWNADRMDSVILSPSLKIQVEKLRAQERGAIGEKP